VAEGVRKKKVIEPGREKQKNVSGGRTERGKGTPSQCTAGANWARAQTSERADLRKRANIQLDFQQGKKGKGTSKLSPEIEKTRHPKDDPGKGKKKPKRFGELWKHPNEKGYNQENKGGKPHVGGPKKVDCLETNKDP